MADGASGDLEARGVEQIDDGVKGFEAFAGPGFLLFGRELREDEQAQFSVAVEDVFEPELEVALFEGLVVCVEAHPFLLEVLAPGCGSQLGRSDAGLGSLVVGVGEFLPGLDGTQ